MQMDFETGLAFGAALADIRHHERRLTDLEQEVVSIRALVNRGALLALLWGAALLTNLPADRIGEIAAGLMRGLGR